LDRWHATNKKSAEKAKSKDNLNSSASRRSGFPLPCTNTEHKLDVGVDQIQDLDDCLIQFQYGKDFLPDLAIEGVPSYMQRMYKRACRVGLRAIYAPHDSEVFGVKGPQIHDITFDFEDIQNMLCLKELGQMVRLYKFLINTNI
jgi:hypothetical protein